jgi:hypothetical protein
MHAMKSSDYELVLGISTYQHIIHTVLVEAAHEFVLGGEGHRSLARLPVSEKRQQCYISKQREDEVVEVVVVVEEEDDAASSVRHT